MTARKRSLRLVFVAGLSAAALLLSGCSSQTPPPPAPSPTQETSVLATHGLADLDAKQLIERLDTMPIAERTADFSASIRADEVVISDPSGGSASVPMPQGEFYVAVAPFVSQTHECHFHSPTGCQGELRNTDATVTVTDDAGKVLRSERTKTFDNGFVGLWLPRGTTGQLTVEAQGKKGTVPLGSSSDQDPTCITTLQLT